MASAKREALQRFLAEEPWREDELHGKRPFDTLFEFELPFAAAEIWPVISDTSTLNKRMALGAMKFEEVDGILHGSMHMAGFDLEWIEVPWDWEVERRLRSARIYSKGFGIYVRSIFRLQPLEENRTRVQLYFGWIPRHNIGRLLLMIGMPRMRRRFEENIRQLISERKQEQAALAASMANAPAPFVAPRRDAAAIEETLSRLNVKRQRLIELGQRPGLVDRIFSWLAAEDDAELYRIRVRKLARKLGLQERDVLLFFLYGVREGLFTLTWDTICPHCRGVRSELRSLGDLPEKDECDACEIDFDTGSIDAFEVTFHLHPSIRVVEQQFYCSAEPAKKVHIRMQQMVAPAQVCNVDLSLSPGVYRLRLKGQKTIRTLEVQTGADRRELRWSASESGAVPALEPDPQLQLHNDASAPAVFLIERSDVDQDALRPADLFNMQEFRDLFSEEALAAGIQLDIGDQAILFTDIVGSSRFYGARGDHGAFAAVRQHFVRLFALIRENNGAVVKTIGDSVMASFARPADAFRAAVAIQKAFPQGNELDVRLRITIHRGPCLAVRLDSNIDYFGNTVNVASKLQALAEAGQIAVSGALVADREAEAALRECGLAPERLEFQQPWDGLRLAVQRVTVS